MQKPVILRELWSLYGVWVVILLVLECHWLPASDYTWMGWFIPVSILGSVMTVFRLVTECNATLRFWRPYIIKWLSWWFPNAFASFIFLSIPSHMISSMLGLGVIGRIVILLLFPTWRLYVHAAKDIREVHRVKHAQYWQEYFKVPV